MVGNQKHESLKNDESFFCDLRYIATLLAKDSITTGEYEQYGRFDRSVMFKKIWQLEHYTAKGRTETNSIQIRKRKRNFR